MVNKLITKYKSATIQMRASFWFLVSSFFQKAISCITAPIFTRLMTPQEYGQFNVFTSWQSICGILITLNIFSGVYMQGIVKFEKERDKYSSSLQGLTLFLCVIWGIIYLAFHTQFNEYLGLTIVQTLCMLANIWSNATFCFWAAEQRVDFKYQKLVILTIVVCILQPVVSIFFVLNAEDKATARIVGITIVQFVAYVGCFFQQMRNGKMLFSKTFWSYAIKFNLPLIPHYLSMTLLNCADRIMIKKMVGEREAGIYSLAYSVSLIMTMFNTAVIQTIEPWIYKKIKAKQIANISSVAYPTLIIIAFLNIMLIAFGPEVIFLFAPESYYEAIYIIPPVAMSVFFMFVYIFFATFEFYYEKTKQIAFASFVGAVLNIILNYYCINRFGYLAAGYTTLICYVVYALFHYLFMRRICVKYLDKQQPYSLKVLLMICTFFILFGFLIMLTYYNAVLRYAFIVLSLLVVFLKRKTIMCAIKKIIQLKKEI